MEEIICPLCNELYNKVYKCDYCEGVMEDKGREQEYYDDYSADDPIDDKGNACVHIFKCNKCEKFERKSIEKVQV
jgi:hypothetical protein